MLGINAEKFDPATINEKRWSLNAALFMLDFAITLVTPNHQNYLQNSKEKLFLRGAFSNEKHEIEIIKYSILELLKHNTPFGRTEFVAKLPQNYGILPIDIAAFWGLLIKDCMNKGDILDLNDPNISQLHDKLVLDLKNCIHKQENPSEIHDAFYTFFQALIEIQPNGHEAFIFFAKFMEFYDLLLKTWDDEVGKPDLDFHRTPMLLGPSFFKSLKLNDKLFDKSNPRYVLLESRFPETALGAFVSTIRERQRIAEANAELEKLAKAQNATGNTGDMTIEENPQLSLMCYETLKGKRSQNRSPKKQEQTVQNKPTRVGIRRKDRFYN